MLNDLASSKMALAQALEATKHLGNLCCHHSPGDPDSMWETATAAYYAARTYSGALARLVERAEAEAQEAEWAALNCLLMGEPDQVPY